MEDDIFMTSAEVMEFLRISRTTLWKWMKSGKIKAHKIGRKYLFSKRELLANNLMGIDGYLEYLCIPRNNESENKNEDAVNIPINKF